MPVIKKPLNMFGLWLTVELNKRGLTNCEFAELMGIKASYLSMLMRTNDSDKLELLAAWKEKSEQYFAHND